ncbi:pentapeptide repeat-containing protein [Planotetraspora phitsanulokensis]|uniref:Pentapeptide repeat-containing protein n=1 Tax=Planotetraspora phitsanulokensis TaxID=575192 RepID=A0A8J3UMI8_9ACTN|nr:pentapeptide repeat-containing protein [Planotetraspora phitsanulokensis]GII41445.1 hypothetical protein Pph01_64480 [Planotetraspora phitsanulokensis]
MPTPTARRRQKEPAAPKVPASLTPARLPEHDLENDGSYRAMLFKSLDLSSRRVRTPEFEGCSLVDTAFAGTEMHRAEFTDVELGRCDLSNMRVRSASVHRAVVSAGRLTGAAWSECAFHDVVFDACRADLTGFRFSAFRTVVFRECTLTEANFQDADLRGARFERCDLTGAQFSNAKMEGTRFADCTLAGIAGVTSLRGAVIRSQDAWGLVHSLAGAMGITIEDAS